MNMIEIIVDWKDPDIADMRVDWIESIVSEVGVQWMQGLSEEELNHFLIWAAEGQVYFYPGNERSLGDAFRGYVTGLRFKDEHD